MSKLHAFVRALRVLGEANPDALGFDAWAINSEATNHGWHAVRNRRHPFVTLERSGKVERVGAVPSTLWRLTDA